MALSDNSKDRIKFACKELEEALSSFEAEAVEIASTDSVPTASAGQNSAQRNTKISEIKRQLRSIREQLDQLSH